jgi:hypothetical protein
VKFQEACGFANGDWFEPGAFDENVFCGERNFGFCTAHNTADADGPRAITIADDGERGIEGALDAVESTDFFAGFCAADDDAMITDFVVVEGVKRVAELEHDVVRDIDNVADAGNAGRFKTVFQPFWRWLDFCAANYAGGKAAAEFGRLDFDFYGF